MNNEKVYQPIKAAVKLLSGKWKLLIVRELIGGPKRFGELKRSLPGITHKVLSETLHHLEYSCIITRTVFPENSLHVEYALTNIGIRLEYIIESLTAWGLEYSRLDTFGAEHAVQDVYYLPNHFKDTDYVTRIQQAKKALANASTILVGAGSGFTAYSGVDYTSKQYARSLFPQLSIKGLTTLRDMISAYTEINIRNQFEFWEFWSRYIYHTVFHPPASDVMPYLQTLLQDREYFIITTNADHQFQFNGFPNDRIFSPLGDYCYLQCGYPCCDEVHPSRDLIGNMIMRLSENGRLDNDSIPRCPYCNDFLVPNHWQIKTIHLNNSHVAQNKQNYRNFVNRAFEQNTILLELGCGFHFPAVIRNPFEMMLQKHSNSTLIRINSEHPEIESESFVKMQRAVAFSESMPVVLHDLVETC